MKRNWLRIFAFLVLALQCPGYSQSPAGPNSVPDEEESVSDEEQALRDRDESIKSNHSKRILDIDTWRNLFLIKDYLSIRMGIRELLESKKLANRKELWHELRELMLEDPVVGQDLRSLWDKLGSREKPIQRILEKRLKDAEELLRLKDYRRAKETLASMAKSLVDARTTSSIRYKDTRHFEDYLRVTIARTLYAMSDYKTAAIAYASISPSYYDYGEILNERIWAHHRAGRNDWALGDLTSLQSGFFGKILRPETLLVGIYSAYELCQNKLADHLRRTYVNNLKTLRSRSQFFDIHDGDPVLLTLRVTLDRSELMDKYTDLYTRAERESERQRIAGYLVSETEKRRANLIKRYETLLRFVAVAPKIAPYLYRKILPSRSEIFQGPFNATRMIKSEIWSDEVGYFLYRPRNETACPDGKPNYEIDHQHMIEDARLRSEVFAIADFQDQQEKESVKRMFFFPRY